MISESDLDHHDTVGRCIDDEDEKQTQQRQFNLHEKLAESLKQRKFDSDDDVPVVPTKKFTSVVRAGPSQLVSVPTETETLMQKFTTTVTNNKAAASVVVLAILIAGAVGFFSHVGVMVRSYQAQSDDVAKFLIYQKKIDDLQMESVELKNRLTDFESRLDSLGGKKVESNTNEGRQYEIKQPPYPPSGSGRGKKVKTRFDQFKRPPVAAGGDEDPVVTIHVSSIDETETWSDATVPPLQDENKNLDIDLDVEAIDPTNFEPILTLEVGENKTFSNPSSNPSSNAPAPEPNFDFSQPFIESTVLENNKPYKQAEESKQFNENNKSYKEKLAKSKERDTKEKRDRGERSNSEERYSKHKKNRSSEREYDRKDQRREGSNERETKRTHYDRKENKEWKRDGSHERHSHKSYKHNKDKHYDDNQEDNSDDYKRLKYEKRDKYEKREKTPERHNSRERGESYNNNKKQYKDESMKREKSFDGSGHKAKYPHEDKDWYMERKEKRENFRKHLDDDWFSERSLDRELLRARTEGSAMRSH